MAVELANDDDTVKIEIKINLSKKDKCMSEPLVNIVDLHLSLVGGAGEVNILRGVNLSITKGETVSVLGPSGAGKTTLLMALSGLEKPTSGQVQVAGVDLTTIDEDGFMQITDRSKDVIKSGGEWISSIDIENIAMAHPNVMMAACIGMPHPKWDERPVVCVVKKPGAEITSLELLKFYEGKTAKWQIPDDVIFVDAIPLGATGKMLKTKLREQLAEYKLPIL